MRPALALKHVVIGTGSWRFVLLGNSDFRIAQRKRRALESAEREERWREALPQVSRFYLWGRTWPRPRETDDVPDDAHDTTQAMKDEWALVNDGQDILSCGQECFIRRESCYLDNLSFPHDQQILGGQLQVRHSVRIYVGYVRHKQHVHRKNKMSDTYAPTKQARENHCTQSCVVCQKIVNLTFVLLKLLRKTVFRAWDRRRDHGILTALVSVDARCITGIGTRKRCSRCHSFLVS